MLFESWSGIGRVLLIGTIAYTTLVVFLQASGKRTLSKLNAFDLVVTVALGSTLATILLSKDVALAEGVAALGLLIVLQFVVTWLSMRSKFVSGLVKSDPALLFYRGAFLRDVMRRERITEDEIRSAVREHAVASLDDVEAVVLETAASISVIRRSGSAPTELLRGVKMPSSAGEPLADDIDADRSTPQA